MSPTPPEVTDGDRGTREGEGAEDEGPKALRGRDQDGKLSPVRQARSDVPEAHDAGSTEAWGLSTGSSRRRCRPPADRLARAVVETRTPASRRRQSREQDGSRSDSTE